MLLVEMGTELVKFAENVRLFVVACLQLLLKVVFLTLNLLEG